MGSPVVHEHPRVPDVRGGKVFVLRLRVCDASLVDLGHWWPLKTEGVEGPPLLGWHERYRGKHRIRLRARRVEGECVFLHRRGDPRWRKGRYGLPRTVLGGHEQGAGQRDLVNLGGRSVGTVLWRNVLAFDHSGGGATVAGARRAKRGGKRVQWRRGDVGVSTPSC